MRPNKTQIYRRNTRPVPGITISTNNSRCAKKNMCNKEQCQTCICSTCMHQGFECDCGEENRCAAGACEDYDEMPGQQMQLNL